MDAPWFRAWSSERLVALGLVGLFIVLGTAVQVRASVTIAILILDLSVVIGGIVGWTVFGRDPVDIDDESVLAAGPPVELSPCLAAVLYEGRGESRALTVALLELAERGSITIHDDPYLGNGGYISRTWIDVRAQDGHRSPALGRPEGILATSLGVDGRRSARIDPIDALAAIGSSRGAFEAALDDEVVATGWFVRPPFQTEARWTLNADFAIATGVLGAAVAAVAAAPGLIAAYLGLVGAGFVGRRIASAMPIRTRKGARLTAMLKAYRRTLRKTLGMSDSVGTVLEARELSWLRTPDRMVVWAMALDLEDELAGLFARAFTRSAERSSDEVWFPEWYGTTVRDGAAMFRSFDHLTGRAR